jgi:hypothetical protein
MPQHSRNRAQALHWRAISSLALDETDWSSSMRVFKTENFELLKCIQNQEVEVVERDLFLAIL